MQNNKLFTFQKKSLNISYISLKNRLAGFAIDTSKIIVFQYYATGIAAMMLAISLFLKVFSTKPTGVIGIRMSGHNVAASSGCGFGYPDVDGGDVTESGKRRDLRIKRDTAVMVSI